MSRLRGGCITWLCFGPGYSVVPSLPFHPPHLQKRRNPRRLSGASGSWLVSIYAGNLGHAPPPAILSLDSPMKSQHRSGGKGTTLTVGRFRILFGPICAHVPHRSPSTPTPKTKNPRRLFGASGFLSSQFEETLGPMSPLILSAQQVCPEGTTRLHGKGATFTRRRSRILFEPIRWHGSLAL